MKPPRQGQSCWPRLLGDREGQCHQHRVSPAPFLGNLQEEGKLGAESSPTRGGVPTPTPWIVGRAPVALVGGAAVTAAERGQPIKLGLEGFTSPEAPHGNPAQVSSPVTTRFRFPRCGRPLWVSCPRAPHSPSGSPVSSPPPVGWAPGQTPPSLLLPPHPTAAPGWAHSTARTWLPQA